MHRTPTAGLTRLLPLLPALLITAIACGTATGSTSSRPPTPTAAAATTPAGGVEGGLSPGEPRPAPPLQDLVRADGRPFDMAELAGHPFLIFFGYTHCPDVCPATIGELLGVLESAPEARAVFVSVDPERDTPEFLAGWTAYLPEHFVALTGSPGAIRRAADGYGVRYARVETTATASYTMSHTADVFLIDADGRLRLSYPFGTGSATILADVSRLSTGQSRA